MGVRAIDFEYDGQKLSDYGMVICDFDSSSGVSNPGQGSVITFNRIQRNGGRHHGLSSAVFNDCYSASFHICKDPCTYDDDMSISSEEYRSLMRWLNRRTFLPFCLYEEDYEGTVCYYDASFNIKKVLVGDVLYGLELTMETAGPFGYGEEIVETKTFANSSGSLTVNDLSDDVGFLYPMVKITVTNSGDISVTSSYDNKSTTIKNCSAGEIIMLSGDAMTITTSSSSHDIANDFNYEFLKIGNTMQSRANTITVSAACTLEIRYHPIVKEVL